VKIRLLLVLCFILISGHIVFAGNPYLAYYSSETDNLLWFIQISDIHIGKSQNAADNLDWIVTDAADIISPSFIVATGDLTDSTNGGLFPNGPYLSEWQDYQQIISGVSSGFYYDVPGNHDHYNNSDFSYYLNYSVTGVASDSSQASWVRTVNEKKYHFMAVNTAGNNGAPFSIVGPYYGDYAGLDQSELAYLESELDNHSDASMTMVFGHHLIDREGADTGLSHGRDAFVDLMDTYGVSLYGYGHSHETSEGFYAKDMTDGVFYFNTNDLAGSNIFRLYAIDCNGISAKEVSIGSWPVVLITSPVDLNLGGGPNPYSYTIHESGTNPVRALVFDRDPVGAVSFRLNSKGGWYPMVPDSTTPGLWVGEWDSADFQEASHTLEVRAEGASVKIDSITIGTVLPDVNSGGHSQVPPQEEQDGETDGIDESESTPAPKGSSSCFVGSL